MGRDKGFNMVRCHYLRKPIIPEFPGSNLQIGFMLGHIPLGIKTGHKNFLAQIDSQFPDQFFILFTFRTPQFEVAMRY